MELKSTKTIQSTRIFLCLLLLGFFFVACNEFPDISQNFLKTEDIDTLSDNTSSNHIDLEPLPVNDNQNGTYFRFDRLSLEDGLLIVGFIAAFYAGHKLRVRNLEKRSMELEIQVKDRTDDLMAAHAALKETDQNKAVIEERNRLARELHDSVTQSLYSLTLFTEAARHLSEATGDEKLEGYLGQIGSLGLQALKEMRLLVFELGLHALEEDNLVEALEKRLKAVEGRTGVDAKVINMGYQKQPPYIETQLFKIAQEALNNALKHADASSVEVHFRQDESTLELEIIDDGVGFKPKALEDGPGMGLNNIKDRVSRMDGTLDIDSEPEKGTRLKVTIKSDSQDEIF